MIDIAIKHFICDKCINVFFDHLLINFNIGPTTTKMNIRGWEAVEMIRNNPNLEAIWGLKFQWYTYEEREEKYWNYDIRDAPNDWDVRNRYR